MDKTLQHIATSFYEQIDSFGFQYGNLIEEKQFKSRKVAR